MTTSITTTSVPANVATPSPAGLTETDRPRVVGRRTGRLVALVAALAVALCLVAAAVSSTSWHRDVAPTVPALVAAAPSVVGDTAHGGPGSWADAVRLAVPPREDDRAVVAHGGAGSLVTGAGTSPAPLP